MCPIPAHRHDLVHEQVSTSPIWRSVALFVVAFSLCRLSPSFADYDPSSLNEVRVRSVTGIVPVDVELGEAALLALNR